MNRTKLVWRAALCLVLVSSLGLIPALARAQETQSPDLFFSEVQTVYLINLERRAAGVPPLRWNRELAIASRTFAQDVVTNLPVGFCGHIDSSNRAPGTRMREAGFTRLGAWAENAVCSYTTPEAAVRAWMNSASHRTNLLDARFREIGMGFALSDSYRGYIVSDFAVDSTYAPVIIDNEAASTNAQQVRLYIYDQATTTGFLGQGHSVEMMISNDPDFAGAAWQPYATETDWQLTGGDGWKTVYVKTRDNLGRTVVASDSIYRGATLPREQLSFAMASHVGSGFRIERVQAEGWSQVQFSLDWVGDDSDPKFVASPNASAPINDASAVGGTAMRLLPGGIATIWADRYLATMPGVAYFRLKVSDNTSTENALNLRIMGSGPDVARLTLRGVDFTAANTYQEFALPYALGEGATMVMFRVDRLGAAEVTVDAVTLYTAPRPLAAPLQWESPDGYLRNTGIQARLVDDEGDFSAPVDMHPASGLLRADGNVGAAPQLTVAPPSVWLESDGQNGPTPVVLNVTCASCTGGPWQASTEQTWLNLEVAGDALQLSANVEGLAPGIYEATVVISVPTATGLSPVIVTVTMMVGDEDVVFPKQLYLPAITR